MIYIYIYIYIYTHTRIYIHTLHMYNCFSTYILFIIIILGSSVALYICSVVFLVCILITYDHLSYEELSDQESLS